MLNDARERAAAHLDSGTPPPHSEEPEALFSVAELRTLKLASRGRKSSVSDFLAHAVARNPAELRRHIQRISLFLDKGNGPCVYGAVVDLFIALGDKGTALRRRMLDLARPLVSEDQYRALNEKLERGLSPLDRVPLSSESILGKGIRGTTRLVERIGTDETSDLDPLTEARSRLEYGQVDEARRVLEEAVLQYPMRGDLHRELLEIYVHSRDYTHFSAMLEALRSAGSPVPSAWRRLASALELVDTGDESPSMEHQGK